MSRETGVTKESNMVESVTKDVSITLDAQTKDTLVGLLQEQMKAMQLIQEFNKKLLGALDK